MPTMITLHCALCNDEFECRKAQWKYKMKTRNQTKFYCTTLCADIATSERQSGTGNNNSKYDPNEIPHGTSVGYKQRGCRCEECIRYNSRRGNRNRKPDHGTTKRAEVCDCKKCKERIEKNKKKKVGRKDYLPENPYIHFMLTYRDDYLWDQVDKDSSPPCWIWNGPNKEGIPCLRFRYNGENQSVFRVQRYLYAKKIETLTWMHNRYNYVDVICGNKLCVNPNHLKEL